MFYKCKRFLLPIINYKNDRIEKNSFQGTKGVFETDNLKADSFQQAHAPALSSFKIGLHKTLIALKPMLF